MKALSQQVIRALNQSHTMQPLWCNSILRLLIQVGGTLQSVFSDYIFVVNSPITLPSCYEFLSITAQECIADITACLLE